MCTGYLVLFTGHGREHFIFLSTNSSFVWNAKIHHRDPKSASLTQPKPGKSSPHSQTLKHLDRMEISEMMAALESLRRK
jgi:hypothetical protein